MAANPFDEMFGPATAAPAGLPQQNTGASGGPATASPFQEMFGENYQAPRWQTGGFYGVQEDAQRNGWQTEFYNKMFTQRDAAIAREDPKELRALPFAKDYTGIVDFDQENKKGQQRKFGDIFEDGKRVGSLFDKNSGYTRDQAYGILADLTLEESDRAGAYKRFQENPDSIVTEVEKKRAENEKSYEAYTSQLDYTATVEDLKDSWDPFASGAAATAAGAVGGIVQGAGLGARFGGLPGAIIGGVVGGAAGGFGAFTNQDELVDMAARTAVQTGLSNEEYGGLAAAGTWAKNWGGAAMQASQISTNLLHGATELGNNIENQTWDRIGDGESTYYEVAEGNGWLKAANFGTTLLDGAINFSSGPGRALFSTTMGVTAGGGAAQFAAQGGATFDDRRGEFHEPENAGQWLAGLGVVGIDAVQLFGGRAIGIAGSGERSATGKIVDFVREKAGHAPTTPQVSIAGRTFKFAEDGTVASVRQQPLQLMAPSEMTSWLGARAKARIRYEKTKVAGVSAESFDDMLYLAARDLQSGTNLMQTTLANAFGEGFEEAAQAVLEPVSHGWNPDAMEVFEAFGLGAAAGAGMSIGARISRRQTDSELDRATANFQRRFDGLDPISKEEWGTMSASTQLQERTKTALGADIRTNLERIVKDSELRPANMVVGAEKLRDDRLAAEARAEKNSQYANEKTRIITAHDDLEGEGAVVRSSIRTIAEDYMDSWDQLENLHDRTEDPAFKAELRAALDLVFGVENQGGGLADKINAAVIMSTDTAFSVDDRRATLLQLEQEIRDMWYSATPEDIALNRVTPAELAASLIYSRDPNDNPGSYAMSRPVIELDASLRGEIGTLQFGFGFLKGMSGDFDGDMSRLRVRIPIAASPELFLNLRTGVNLLTKANGTVTMAARQSEETFATQMLREVDLAGGPSGTQVQQTISDIQTYLLSALATMPNQPRIKTLVDQYGTQMLAGNPEAKLDLFNALAVEEFASEFQRIAREGGPASEPRENLMIQMDARMFKELQKWRDAASLHIQPQWGVSKWYLPAPGDNQSTHIDRQQRAAATPLQSAYVGAEGTTTPIRVFQNLYYVAKRTGQLDAVEMATYNQTLSDIYIAMNSGIHESVSKSMLDGDVLAGGAQAIIERVTRDLNLSQPGAERAAAAMVAAMPVPKIRREEDGSFTIIGQTTVAQYALEQTATILERDRDMLAGLHDDALLEFKMAKFLNPEEAYLRVYGSHTLQQLLGDATSFQAGMTLNGLASAYRSESSQGRKVFNSLVSTDLRFKGKYRGDLPIPQEEVEAGNVTPFSVMINSVMSAVNKEISYDRKTHQLHGSMVTRDDREIENTELGQQTVRRELAALASTLGENLPKARSRMKAKKSKEAQGYSARDVQRVSAILDRNPEMTRRLLDLVPEASRPATFKIPGQGEQFALPNWFIDFVLMEDSQEAAMLLYRQNFLTAVRVQSSRNSPYETKDELMALYLQATTDPIQRKLFMDILTTSRSITEFRQRLNEGFEMGAPKLAFFRDSAMFNPDMTSGGWNRSLPGTEYREAIQNFRSTADRFSETVTATMERSAQDLSFAMSLPKLRDSARAGDSAAQAKVARIVQRLQDAARMGQPLGPAALLRAPMLLLTDLISITTDKGKGSEATVHLAEREVRGDGMVIGTGYAQLIAHLSSFDASDTANNAAALAGNGEARMVDDDGHQFTLPELTFDAFVDLMQDVKNHDALRTMLLPSARELQADGTTADMMLYDGSFQDWANQDIYSDILYSPDVTSKLKYLGMLDAEASRFGGTNAVVQWISEIVIARTAGFDHEISTYEAQQLTIDTAVLVADLLRGMGEPSMETLRADLDAALKSYGKKGVLPTVTDKVTRDALTALIETHVIEYQVLTGDMSPNAVSDALLETDTVKKAALTYLIDWDDATDIELKKKMMWDMVREQGGLAFSSTTDILKELQRSTLMDPNGKYATFTTSQPALDKAKWDEVSRALIGVHIQRAVIEISPRHPAIATPKDLHERVRDVSKLAAEDLVRSTSGDSRFFDPSFRYLFDPLLQGGDGSTELSPLMQAARSVRQYGAREASANVYAQTSNVLDSATKILETIEHARWTPALASHSIGAAGAIRSGGVNMQIALSGMAFKQHETDGAASRRTYERPDPASARKYVLDGALLASFLDPDMTIDAEQAFRDSSGEIDSLSILNGRFLTGARVLATNAAGDEVSINLLPATAVTGEDVAPTSAGDTPSIVGATLHGYQFTTIPKLRMSLQSVRTQLSNMTDVRVALGMFHPEDRPGGAAWNGNLFYGGAVTPGVGDTFQSPVTALHMATDASSQLGQRGALDSTKTGSTAYRAPELPSLQAVRDLEDVHAMYEMLRGKTELLMRSSLGHFKLDPMVENSVYADLAQRHLVRSKDDQGNTQILSAQQAIEIQKKGTLPADAELIVLSPRQFNTLYRDQNGYGLKTDVGTAATMSSRGTMDPTTPLMELIEERLPQLLEVKAGSLLRSGLGRPTRTRRLTVQDATTLSEQRAHQARTETQLSLARDIHTLRNGSSTFRDEVANKNRYERVVTKVREDAARMASFQAARFHSESLPIPLATVADSTDSAYLSYLVGEALQEIPEQVPGATAFQFRFRAKTGEVQSDALLIGLASLNESQEQRAAGNIPVRGDIVDISLEDFNEADAAQMERVIHHLTSRGVYIAFSSTDGARRDARQQGFEALKSAGYRRVRDSALLWRPPVLGETRYATLESYYSKIAETTRISSRGRVVTFQSFDGFGLEENGMGVNIRDVGPSSGRVMGRSDIVPLEAYVSEGFALAKTPGELASVQKTLQELAKSDEMQEHLLSLSYDEKYFFDADSDSDVPSRFDWLRRSKRSVDARKAELKLELTRAIQRALDNYTTEGVTTSLGLPASHTPFKTGDLIVQVDARGNILLMRSGHDPIDSNRRLKEQLSQPTPGSWGFGKVAIYGPVPRNASTTSKGEILEWQGDPTHGLRAVLAVEPQIHGGKGFSNQMKYTFSDLNSTTWKDLIPEGLEVIPGHPLFGISNYADDFSKQNFKDTISNAQAAIAFFGFDFVPAFTETFLDASITQEAWTKLSEGQRQEYRRQTQDFLENVRRSADLSVAAVMEMQAALHPEDGTSEYLSALSLGELISKTGVGDLVKTDLSKQEGNPSFKLAAAMVQYMMSDVAVDARTIMSTQGMMTSGAEVQSTMMPELFTQVIDRAPIGSPLRQYVFEQFNAVLGRAPGAKLRGLVLQEDWTTVLANGNGLQATGMLAFAPMQEAGSNPVMQEQAQSRTTSADASRQHTKVMEQVLGVAPRLDEDVRAQVNKKLDPTNLPDVNTVGAVYNLLTGALIRDSVRDDVTRILNPRERERLEQQREKREEYYAALDTSEWTQDEKNRFTQTRASILRTLKWDEPQAYYVDSWIRMGNASPKEKDAETSVQEGHVPFDRAMKVMSMITANLSKGMLPTYGFQTMMGHTAQEAMMFAQGAQRGGWQMDISDQTFEGYAAVILGAMTAAVVESNTRFAINGIANTFRELGGAYKDLNISLDTLDSLGLLDSTTNDLPISLEATDAAQLREPDTFNLVANTIQDAVQGNAPVVSETPGTADLRRWEKKNGRGQMTPRTYNELLQGYGRQYTTTGTSTTGFIRTILLLRTAQGMANPILWGASIGEMIRSGAIESLTSLLSGSGASVASQWLNKATGEKLMGQSVATQKRANSTAKSLANNSLFRGMMYQETTNQMPLENAGRVEAFMHRMVTRLGRLQDGTYGIPPVSQATRYVEGALQVLRDSESEFNMTPESLLQRLDDNPRYLVDTPGLESIHAGAIRGPANIRMMNPSVATQAFRLFADPALAHSNGVINGFSNLAVKIPTMFLPFALNLGTSMLGLQFLQSAVAVGLGGRADSNLKKGQRWHSFMSGNGMDFNESHGHDFLTETVDGMNLTNEFIKSGASLTSLMALGLLGHSLALTGEDEEEKRRRRMAEVAGTSHIFDPRSLERDFRNKDAIYLHNLPPMGFLTDLVQGLTQVKAPDEDGEGAVSMAELHWSMKMFLSPMMGVERFINNGDLKELTLGFQDALGSMPLINMNTFDDATRVATELYLAAADNEATGDPATAPKTFNFLVNIGMAYERMLLENAFVNELYSGLDKYDRDPTARVDLSADGDIQFDDTGQPMRTRALNTFEKDDGTIGEGRLQYSESEQTWRQMAEGRATWALLGSLKNGAFLPGQQGSMWRQDMAVKERYINKTDLEVDDAGELIMSLYNEKNKREELTFAGSFGIIHGLRMGSVRPEDPALQHVWIPFEHRLEINDALTERIMQDGIDYGLTHQQATERYNTIMYGQDGNPHSPRLFDIIWSQGDYEGSISYNAKTVYRQLNTTYVTGPDGFPMATGFTRQQAMPFQTQVSTGDGALPWDSRLNSVDSLNDINTGLRALEVVNGDWANPTIDDIMEAIKDSTEKIVDAIQESSMDSGGSRYGGGFSGYRRSGGGGGYSRSGGGGGNYGGWSFRLNSPERSNPTYARDEPYVRMNNPIIRRATVRRERYSSERGRLNQWQ